MIFFDIEAIENLLTYEWRRAFCADDYITKHKI